MDDRDPGRMTRRQAIAALGALALPFDRLSARDVDRAMDPLPFTDPRLPIADSPDLGNLYGTIDWIARESAPSLSFLDPRWRSLEAWKMAARDALHRALAFDPDPDPVCGDLCEGWARQRRERRGRNRRDPREHPAFA